MFETLVTENKIIEYEDIFNGYKLFWIPAKKPTIGRPSEGYVFGIKQNKIRTNILFVVINGMTLIEIQQNESKFFILPMYINFNIWQHQFDKMYSFINEFSEQNLMIIGDLNARIGNENISGIQEIAI